MVNFTSVKIIIIFFFGGGHVTTAPPPGSATGSIMCKPGGTEGESRERALQGRKVVGSLGRIMKGRSVSMELKRDLKNTVITPTLTYASETWAWNESQRSRVQAVEMIYLRSACGVSKMD